MKNLQKTRLFIQFFSIFLSFFGFFIHFQFTLTLFLVISFFAGAFHCGWICPFGSLQEFMQKLRLKLNIKKRRLTKEIHKVLILLRYFVFILFSVSSLDILFTLASYDPRVNITSLLKGNLVSIGAISVIVIFCYISLFYDRLFCNYLCMEGAKFGLLSKFRFLSITRKESTCISCNRCNSICPMNIEVSTIDSLHSPQCIHCFECVTTCPIPNTLTFGLIKWSPKSKKYYKLLGVFVIFIALTAFVFTSLSKDLQVNKAQNLDASSHSEGLYQGKGQGNKNDNKYDIKNNTLSSSDTSNVSLESPMTYDGQLVDGIYSGSGPGFRGDIRVEVTIENQHITKVEVINHQEDYRWFVRAYAIIPSAIIEAQNISVDTVSGATYSSRGIILGVADALDNMNKEHNLN